MADAALTLSPSGRNAGPVVRCSLIKVTVVASSTTYAASSGGLPIDLTGILQQAAPPGGIAPNYTQAIHPSDVLGILPMGLSTNKFLPANLVIGTPTYTTTPWESAGNAAGIPGILATCPATIRLYGTGSGNAAAFAEVADGANSDTVTFWLVIARNGANS